MDDPTAEVIMVVEIRVKVTDTRTNDSTELSLNEYQNTIGKPWAASFKSSIRGLADEMQALVAASEMEKARKP